MNILKVTRLEAKIVTSIQTDGQKAEREIEETSKEAPKPEFDQSLQSLNLAIEEIMEVPINWTKECEIESVSVSYTEAGTRSAIIKFERPFASVGKKSKAYSTPQFRFDNPQGNEKGSRECSEVCAGRIATFLNEATAYINGDRLQQLLPLNTVAKEDGAADGDPLPFGDDSNHLDSVTQQIKDCTSKKAVDMVCLDQTGDQIPSKDFKALKLPELKAFAIEFIMDRS